MEWVDRIRWYTRPTAQERLRAEYLAREEMLAYARELERIAAELQDCADELRRLVG